MVYRPEKIDANGRLIKPNRDTSTFVRTRRRRRVTDDAKWRKSSERTRGATGYSRGASAKRSGSAPTSAVRAVPTGPADPSRNPPLRPNEKEREIKQRDIGRFLARLSVARVVAPKLFDRNLIDRIKNQLRKSAENSHRIVGDHNIQVSPNVDGFFHVDVVFFVRLTHDQWGIFDEKTTQRKRLKRIVRELRSRGRMDDASEIEGLIPVIVS